MGGQFNAPVVRMRGPPPRASLDVKEMAKISAPACLPAPIALRHTERGLVTTVTELSQKMS